jgi:hypothetical protein
MRSFMISAVVAAMVGAVPMAYAQTAPAPAATTTAPLADNLAPAPVAQAPAKAKAKVAAGHVVHSKVKSVSYKKRLIRLTDGHLYHLSKGLHLPKLMIGEKVTVDWAMHGKTRYATSISAGK